MPGTRLTGAHTGTAPADGPGARRWRAVLVHGHHDVRAVKDQEWQEAAPFGPALRQGRTYGRGASDAKGQAPAHVWALRAHLHATGRSAPAVTLKYPIEGEEEINSPPLAGLVHEHADRLAADVVTVSDTMLWSPREAAVCVGVRGSVDAHLEVRGPRRDVHSDVVAGAAPSPPTETCRLVGLLHDEQWRVTLPGFHDPVADPSAEERRGTDRTDCHTDAWLERTRTRSVQGEAGHSVPERVWTRPAAEGAPAVLLAEPLDACALFYGTGLPEDHWHDSDEKAEVRALLQGAETLACLLDDLPGRLHA